MPVGASAAAMATAASRGFGSTQAPPQQALNQQQQHNPMTPSSNPQQPTQHNPTAQAMAIKDKLVGDAAQQLLAKQQQLQPGMGGDGTGPNLQQRVFSTPVQMQPLKKNQNEMVGNWILGKTIGRGSFAEVRLARNIKTATAAQLANPQTPYSAVVKITNLLQLHDPQIQRVQLQREIATLMELGEHPHIVKVLDVMQSPSRTYLFLEYVDGMELYDFLKGQPTGHVPEDIVRLITWQLLGALEYMSGKKVLHRDIKLDNVLLNKRGDVKIIDFNLATFVEKGKANLTEAVGCVHYAAPTILACAITKQPYSDEGGWPDVWSLGVAIFSLLQGVFPFRSTNALRLLQEIKAMADSGGLLYPVPVSKTCRDFVSTMLNPRARPTATDMMRHPWMAGLARVEPTTSPVSQQQPSPVAVPASPVPPPTAAPAAPAEPFKKPILLRPSLGGRTATSSAVPTLASFNPTGSPNPAPQPIPTVVQPSADVRIAYAAQEHPQPQVGESGQFPMRPRLQPRANTASAVPTLRTFAANAPQGFNDPRDGTIQQDAARMGQPVQQPQQGQFRQPQPPQQMFAQPQQQQQPRPQASTLFGYAGQQMSYGMERPPLQQRANTMGDVPGAMAAAVGNRTARMSGGLTPMDLVPPVKRASGTIDGGMDDQQPGQNAGQHYQIGNRMALDYIVSAGNATQQSQFAQQQQQGMRTAAAGQPGGYPMMTPAQPAHGPAVSFQPNPPHYASNSPRAPLHLQTPRPQLQPRSISSGAVPTLRSFLAKASAAALDADSMDTSSATDSDSEAGNLENDRGSGSKVPPPLRRSNTTHGPPPRQPEGYYFGSAPASREDSGYGTSNGSLGPAPQARPGNAKQGGYFEYQPQAPGMAAAQMVHQIPTIQQHPGTPSGSEADDMEF